MQGYLNQNPGRRATVVGVGPKENGLFDVIETSTGLRHNDVAPATPGPTATEADRAPSPTQARPDSVWCFQADTVPDGG